MAVVQSEQDEGQAARSTAASRLAARRAAKAAEKASKRGTTPMVSSRIGRGVQAAQSWYEQNQKMLALTLGGAVLAGAGWIVLAQFLDQRSHEAAESLETGIATANAPIVAAGAEPPSGPAPEESYPTARARAEKAQGELHATAARFPSASAGLWAKLAEANQLRELGKPADAQKLYDQVLAASAVDPFLRVRALEGSGFALEAQQKPADAAKRFEQIAAVQGGGYKAISEYQRARMEIALGQGRQAAERLQALVKAERARPPGEGTSTDGLVTDAETLLTELSVELDAPALRPESPHGGTVPSAPPAQQGTALTKDIVDALRKQLESGKGGHGLSKDVVDALQKQVESGNTSSTTTKVRVPVPSGDKPK
ncbi:MAG: hypothetical protein ACHQ53_05545 [Polyangiales bacterium]